MTPLQNNKLDEKIKDSLRNYEASNQSADWSRMESMLNATPKVAKSNWSSVFFAFIGLAVLSGVFLVYTKLNQTKPVEQTMPTTEVKTENKVSTPVSDPIVPKTEADITIAKPATEAINKTENKVATTSNKTETTATDNKSTVKPKILIMGNTPVFGDMLDSTKGIIGETKEKEETKKAAVTNSDKPIGWNKFLNSDSIKKWREQQLKDSLKASNNKKK